MTCVLRQLQELKVQEHCQCSPDTSILKHLKNINCHFDDDEEGDINLGLTVICFKRFGVSGTLPMGCRFMVSSKFF